MPLSSAHSRTFLSIWLSLLLVTFSTSSGTVTTTSRITTSIPIPATCPARTVNYITHRLPQQCAKTSWKAGDAVPTPTETDTENGAMNTSEVTTIRTAPTATTVLAVSDATATGTYGVDNETNTSQINSTSRTAAPSSA